MMLALRIAVLLSFAAIALGEPAAAATLSERSRATIYSEITRNAETANPGDSIPILGGATGSIRLRAKLSASDPSTECTACSDPCRSFTVDVTDTEGEGSFYGDVCRDPSSSWTISSFNTERWTPAPPKQEGMAAQNRTPRPAAPPPPPPTPPGPDKELVASVHANLVALRYMPDGAYTGASLLAGIQAFASDAQMDVSQHSATSLLQINDALAKAVERGKPANCNVAPAAKHAYVMCGALAGK